VLTQLTETENPQHQKQGLPFKAHSPRKTYFVPLKTELRQLCLHPSGAQM